MITKEQALELLHSKMQSVNLRKHCYAVGAVMKSLALKFEENEDKWEIVGLLHDGDYEFTKEDHSKHAKLMADWVRELGETDEELLTGIESHGWFHEGKKPGTLMQWALFCSDELTGLITAVTLVRPEKKISLVTVENILSKWNQKSFASGVKREDIENCEKELGIPLSEFIEIALKAMQDISGELGL
jgi:predicted hydrolase (HD superfamily)